jgi:hypothetical protein
MNTQIHITKKQQKINKRDEARTRLLDVLKPGDTVSCILRHVSRSGMMRHISLLVGAGSDVQDITWLAARAMDMKLADDRGIKIGGCGMDMGFALVYNLGRTLWPKGTDKPHGRRNGEPDSDGGYALKHRWL